MAGMRLALSSGADADGFKTLRLSVGELFSLEWAPLMPDRTHIALRVLTPCCAAPLGPNLSPTGEPTACGTCGKAYPYRHTIFHFALTRGAWAFDGNSFSALVEEHCPPLTSDVAVSGVSELLREIMRRASGEYAWEPEGNLRGAAPLSLEKQERICQGLLDRFRGEVVDVKA